MTTLNETVAGRGLDTQVTYGDESEKMSLKEAISRIPGEDGWWKSHSQAVFEKRALELLENGFSAEQALWLLEDLYGAVAGCFGN